MACVLTNEKLIHIRFSSSMLFSRKWVVIHLPGFDELQNNEARAFKLKKKTDDLGPELILFLISIKSKQNSKFHNITFQPKMKYILVNVCVFNNQSVDGLKSLERAEVSGEQPKGIGPALLLQSQSLAFAF
jgi:hypothetical protein